jgi:hyaluronate lyase
MIMLRLLPLSLIPLFASLASAASPLPLALDAPLPPGGVEALPGDTQRVELDGPWRISHAGGNPRERQFALRSRNEPEPMAVTYRLNVEKPGRYVVLLETSASAHVWQNSNPIRIEHADGVFIGDVNVAMGVGGWKPLGEWAFEPNQPAVIRLEAPADDRRVGFGGVRLIPAVVSDFPAPYIPLKENARNDFQKGVIGHLRRLTAADVQPPYSPELYRAIEQTTMDAATAYASLDREYGGSLWADFRHGNDPLKASRNLARIALILSAYYSPHVPDSLGLRGNPQLIADMTKAVEWVTANLYSDDTPWGGAWWWRIEIGVPRGMNDSLVLLRPHVDRAFLEKHLAGSLKHNADPRKFYREDFRSGGTNRIWLSQVAALRGMLLEDDHDVEQGREAAIEELSFGDQRENPSLSGFQSDGSFIMHRNILYNTGYGGSFYNTFVSIYELLNGTKWEYSTAETGFLTDFYFKGMTRVSAFANNWPGVQGRAFGGTNPPHARWIAGVGASMYAMAPADRKADVAADYHVHLQEAREAGAQDDFRRDSLAEMLRVDAAIQAQPAELPERRYSQVFYRGDAFLHRRPDFAFGVSMTSSRIADHECIWGSNQNGWYQGHGFNWIVNRGDPMKYGDGWRAAVDPYRLAGVTLDKRERPPGSQAGGNSGQANSKDWVGGVSLLDQHAAIGMEIEIVLADETVVPLSGRKSWFAFEDEIVVMGSGITSGSEYPVETVIENARIERLDLPVIIDGSPVAIPDDAPYSATNPQFIHAPGNANSSGLGIVIMEPATLQVLRAERTGAPSEGSRNLSTTPITRPFVTIYYDHGIKPQDQRFAYMLLPTADAKATEAIAKENPVDILAFTDAVHAVRHKSLMTIGANFFESGQAGPISADQPCSLMIKRKDDQMHLVLSDPTQKQTDPITVRADFNTGRLINASEGVTVHSTSPLVLSIDPTGAMGAPFSATFAAN